MKEDSVKFSVTAKGGTLILVSSQQSTYEWPQVFADKLHFDKLQIKLMAQSQNGNIKPDINL